MNNDDDLNDGDSEENEIYHLAIEHVYLENHLSFGQIMEVRLSMRNVDSASDSKIYVVDENGDLISEEKSFRFFRNSNARFTQEIVLDETCERSAYANIILESFDMVEERQVFIQCQSPLSEDLKSDNHYDIQTSINSKNHFSLFANNGIAKTLSNFNILFPEIHGLSLALRNSYSTIQNYNNFSLKDFIPGLVLVSFFLLGIATLLFSE